MWHKSRRGLGFNSKQKQFDFFLMKVFSPKFYNLKKLWHVAQNDVKGLFCQGLACNELHKDAFERVKKLKIKKINDGFRAHFLRCSECVVRSSSRQVPPEDRQEWTQSPEYKRGFSTGFSGAVPSS